MLDLRRLNQKKRYCQSIKIRVKAKTNRKIRNRLANQNLCSNTLIIKQWTWMWSKRLKTRKSWLRNWTKRFNQVLLMPRLNTVTGITIQSQRNNRSLKTTNLNRIKTNKLTKKDIKRLKVPTEKKIIIKFKMLRIGP